MAEQRLDTPRERKKRFRLPKIDLRSEKIGAWSETFARMQGTTHFILYLTIFVVVWLLWNTMAPESMQFDKASLGFTALTLMLSLQASYASPLILLAQNRQDDRDRVATERDRQNQARLQSDIEYLTREIASLRLLMQETATRDFVRGEMRDLLEDLSDKIDALTLTEAHDSEEKQSAESRDSSERLSDGESAE